MKPPHHKKSRRRLTRQLVEVRRRFIHWVNSGASEEHPFCKPNGILNFKL